jgi:hypothetical protein
MIEQIPNEVITCIQVGLDTQQVHSIDRITFGDPHLGATCYVPSLVRRRTLQLRGPAIGLVVSRGLPFTKPKSFPPSCHRMLDVCIGI